MHVIGWHKIKNQEIETPLSQNFCFLGGEMRNNEHDQNGSCRSRSLKDWRWFPTWIIHKDFKKEGYQVRSASHNAGSLEGWEERIGGKEEGLWEKFQCCAGPHNRHGGESVTGEGTDVESGDIVCRKLTVEGRVPQCVPWRWGTTCTGRGQETEPARGSGKIPLSHNWLVTTFPPSVRPFKNSLPAYGSGDNTSETVGNLSRSRLRN